MIGLGRRGGADEDEATEKPGVRSHVARCTLAATLSSSFTGFHLVEIHLVLNN